MKKRNKGKKKEKRDMKKRKKNEENPIEKRRKEKIQGIRKKNCWKMTREPEKRELSTEMKELWKKAIINFSQSLSLSSFLLTPPLESSLVFAAAAATAAARFLLTILLGLPAFNFLARNESFFSSTFPCDTFDDLLVSSFTSVNKSLYLWRRRKKVVKTWR